MALQRLLPGRPDGRQRPGSPAPAGRAYPVVGDLHLRSRPHEGWMGPAHIRRRTGNRHLVGPCSRRGRLGGFGVRGRGVRRLGKPATLLSAQRRTVASALKAVTVMGEPDRPRVVPERRGVRSVRLRIFVTARGRQASDGHRRPSHRSHVPGRVRRVLRSAWGLFKGPRRP